MGALAAVFFLIPAYQDEYKAFQEAIITTFTKTNFQLWFCHEDTDNYLYKTNAGYEGGATLSSIQLPKTLDEFKTYIIRLHEKQQADTTSACITCGWFILGLIASRHFLSADYSCILARLCPRARC